LKEKKAERIRTALGWNTTIGNIKSTVNARVYQFQVDQRSAPHYQKECLGTGINGDFLLPILKQEYIHQTIRQ